jgi:septal ring factor EnvC (AmiA/AmiB activator)
MFMFFMLFVPLKAEEEELKECQKRRDSVEKELSEPVFAIAQAEKGCESLAKELEAYERIGEEKGNTSTELTNTISDPVRNNCEVKDMADSMNEETSFEAECNTGECGAPD